MNQKPETQSQIRTVLILEFWSHGASTYQIAEWVGVDEQIVCDIINAAEQSAKLNIEKGN